MSPNELNLSVAEFAQHTDRRDGQRVVAGLSAGLELLNNLLYWRLHRDVEKTIGADSMLVPVSEVKARQITHTEIGLYQIAESAAAVRQSGYWPAGDDGCVPWLARLTLGESSLSQTHQQRIDGYMGMSVHARRLAFTDVLATALPESRRAPLVLFLLFPLAVQIVTALAFGDRPTADRLRTSQVDHLPIIPGCNQCHGRVLENGDSCGGCENPLWKTDWLTSVE
jgi:hypothetical protein